MFTVRILDKKGTKTLEMSTLAGITAQSTGYEYGSAIAGTIEKYVRDCQAVLVEVKDPDNHVIHKLAVVPKAGAVMVTENGADNLPLTYQFRQSETKLPERYLIMVNPDKNNNKFYRMIDLGNRTWGAFYGRVGEKQGESVYSDHVTKPYEYPDYMYSIKYQEKILKGYRDKTECHKTDEVRVRDVVEFSSISEPMVAELIRRLMQYAKKTIEQNYTVASKDVTPQMIKEAKKELDALRKVKTLNCFNSHLLEMMHIIPRRMDGYGAGGVAASMAHSTEEFTDIILREESLLDVMEGQVNVDEKRKCNRTKPVDILKALDIEIHVATPEQIQDVEKHLNNSLKPKLVHVYRVINKRTQAAFEAYLNLQEKEGNKVAVKQFWHGSRNENWMSILQKGLVLNPDAIITGKMFGQGIYFAPSAMKSWGYTSAPDAVWTKRNTGRIMHTAFMALYATAYGKPYELYSHTGIWQHYNYQCLHRDHPDCSCVHAKASKGMLHNDEVIFYREDQMTINYICEFAA